MIKRKTKALICVLLLLSLAMSAVSCDYLREFYGQGEESTTEPEEITTPKEEITTPEGGEESSGDNTIITLPPVDVEMKFINPYTGLPCMYDLKESRAIAFVVDNSYFSAPQDGIGNADILYEFKNTEGGTTLLAIYKNPESAVRVGPLGTASKVMLDIAKCFDAIIFARNTTESLKNQPNADIYVYESNGALPYGFFEASDRKNEFGYKYSVIGEGVRLLFALKDKNVNLTSDSAYSNIFTFYSGEREYELSGKNTSNIHISVSQSQHIQFAYSQSEKAYYRYQFGDKIHSDSMNGSMLSFKNLFFLMGSADNSLGEDEIKLGVQSRGSGYYACNGRYTQISWVRDYTGVFKFYKADGTVLEVPAGKSYIGFFSASDMTSVSFK